MEYIEKEGSDVKLWIFGDSFTGIRHETDSWPVLLHKYFVGKHAYVSSQGSRDIQTIIDIFLKNLHKIKEDDFVILMLPVAFRFRLPLENLQKDVQYGNIKEHNYENMFIGNNMYDSIREIEKIKDDSFENMHKYNSLKLESPLCYADPRVFRLEDHDINKAKLNIASVIGIINSSKAVLRNYNEILSSFKNYFPFKIKIYSWENELDDSIVDTKNIITNKCNLWHTMEEDFIETNGESGLKGDGHWSKKMDKAFANMVIKENPKYFNQNLI
jgi:hypothetical protein